MKLGGETEKDDTKPWKINDLKPVEQIVKSYGDKMDVK
jgi:hypothetical protein